ncbi:MAG: glutamate--cysteine ligase [Proteobacteria bacterium SG_bin7]|nr:MAG: glutamate--cysteine ligase [Proteobacteria bacterium SG_bin7]
MEIKNHLHEVIVKRHKVLCDWICNKEDGLIVPFYSSFDIRDSGSKVATVDANIFPAGFNNICEADCEHADDLARAYLDKNYGKNAKKVLLLTEEHTNNAYYWENVATLVKIVEGAGRAVRVAFPKEVDSPLNLESAGGKKITVYSAKRDGSVVSADGFSPDLIISNNDFANEYAEWSKGLSTTINPPREMGWYRRKKSEFFKEYNAVAEEFAKLISVDPWMLQIDTEVFENFDLSDEGRTDELANKVEDMIKRVRQRYKERGISEKPFVFVKNNAGTYGLGIIQVGSGEEIRELNYKARKKMKAAKGGRDVSEVIIQEGISTAVLSDGMTAEPAIYLIGCQLAGGFLRVHKEKGPQENLNSPGAVYKKLCVSDLEINIHGRLLENVYGWVARLGLLAIGREYKSYLATKK